jgi:hypothetical protein
LTEAVISPNLRFRTAWRLELQAAAAGSAAYFCAYAFRKPFLAAEFTEVPNPLPGLETKTLFVLSQVVGYATSKYFGVKVCSETTRPRLGWMLAGLIAVAELALIAFGLSPAVLKPFAMLLNGLALGMVWGHVVRYLEGRPGLGSAAGGALQLFCDIERGCQRRRPIFGGPRDRGNLDARRYGSAIRDTIPCCGLIAASSAPARCRRRGKAVTPRADERRAAETLSASTPSGVRFCWLSTSYGPNIRSC